jgi:hypothetical protein
VDDAPGALSSLAKALETQGALVLRVHGNRDPLGSVIQALEQGPPVHQLNLFGHGAPGRFLLGRSIVSSHSLPYQQERWQRIGALLDHGAGINFFGCDLAASAAGVRLIDRLQQLTGQGVAASDDLTYQQANRSDWDLEVKVGQPSAGFDADQLSLMLASLGWQGTLSAQAPLAATFNSSSGLLQIERSAGAELQEGQSTVLLPASQWAAVGPHLSAIAGLALGQGLWLRPSWNAQGDLVGDVELLPGLEGLVGLESPELLPLFDAYLGSWAGLLPAAARPIEPLRAEVTLDLGPVPLAASLNLRFDNSGPAPALVLELSQGRLDLGPLGLGSVDNLDGTLRWTQPGAPAELVLTSSAGLGSADLQLAGSLTLRRDASSSDRLQLSGNAMTLTAGDPLQGPAVRIDAGLLQLDLTSTGSSSGRLQLSGSGSLLGIAGASLNASLTYSRIPASGANPAQERFEASGASLSLPGMGPLQGNLLLTRQRQTSSEGTTTQLWVSLDNSSGSLSGGSFSSSASSSSLSLNLSQVAASVLLETTLPQDNGSPRERLGLDLSGSIGLQLGSLLSLHGNAIALQRNSSDSAISGFVPVAQGSRLLDLAAGSASLSGRWSGMVAGLGSLSGPLTISQRQGTLETSDGRWVPVQETLLSGKGLSLALGGSGSSSLVQLDNAAAAVVLAEALDGSGRWISAKVQPGQLALAGQGLLPTADGAFSLNAALDSQGQLLSNAPVLVWRTPTVVGADGLSLDAVDSSQRLSFNGALALANGSLEGTMSLERSITGNTPSWSLQLANASLHLPGGGANLAVTGITGTLAVAAGGLTSGSLSGQLQLAEGTGLSLGGSASVSLGAQGIEVISLANGQLAIPGFGSLTAAMQIRRQVDSEGSWLELALGGVSGRLGASDAGLQISNGTLALLLGPSALGPCGYALQGSASLSLVGLGGGTSLSGQALLTASTLGREINRSIAFNAGANSTAVTLAINEPRPQHQVQVTGGQLLLAGVGSLNADLTLAVQETIAADGTELSQISVAVDNGSLALGLGSLGASLTNLSGAVLLRQGAPAPLGLDLEGTLALSGLDGVRLQAERVSLVINTSGSGLSATIPAAGGWRALELVAGERRLRGAISLAVDNLMDLSGELALESRSNQTLRLSDGSNVTVSQLVLAGDDLALRLGSSGGSAQANLNGLDGVLVISTEVVAGSSQAGARRWLSLQGSSSSGALASLPLESGSSTSVVLNQALTPVGTPLALDWGSSPVPDWSNAPLNVPVAGSQGLSNFVLGTGTRQLALGLGGSISLDGLALSGTIAANLERSTSLNSWRLTVANGTLALGSSGGASLSLTGANGSLQWGDDGSRSGSLSGAVALQGVAGISLSGTLSANYSSAGALQVAGQLRLGVDGFGELEGQFSIERVRELLALPREELVQVVAGASGSISQLVQGGSGQGAAYIWRLGGVAELPREGTYTWRVGDASVQVASLDGSGRPLGDAALARALSSALESLPAIGSGNLTVSGSRANGFVLQLGAALAATNPVLRLEPPADPGASVSRWLEAQVATPSLAGRNEEQLLTLAAPASGGGSFSLGLTRGSSTDTTAAIPLLARVPSNEKLVLTLQGNSSAAGQLRLGLGGQSSAPIRLGTGPLKTQNDLQAALEGLVGSGNVSVRYSRGYTGHDSIDYLISFQGAKAGQNLPDLSASATTTAVKPLVTVLQQGSTGQSVEAQAAAMATALNQQLGAGSVAVSWDSSSSSTSNTYRLRFGGALANSNLPTLAAAVQNNANASVSLAEAVAGAAPQAAIQQLRLGNASSNASLQLNLTAAGVTYTSAAIAADASAEAVQQALLAASSAQGGRLGSSGATVSVSALAANAAGPGWQVVLGGGLAGASVEPLRAQLNTPLSLGTASLTLQSAAIVNNEQQQLSLGSSGLFRLAISGGSDSTAVFDAALLAGQSNSTAAQALQAGLSALSGIGSGNLSVSRTGTGTYALNLEGSLAGLDVAALQVLPVQRFSLLQTDGQLPGSVQLRLGSDGSWTSPVNLTGLSQSQAASAIALQLATLPGLGLDVVSVQTVAGQDWTFELQGSGALLGSSLPALQLLTSLTTSLAPEKLLLGASAVSGRIGSSQAGLAIGGGTLGLLLSTGSDGTARYALEGSATATLQGFDNQVTLSAPALLRLNTLGEAVHQTITTGLAPSNGVAPSLDLNFADGSERRELLIGTSTTPASVSVAGVASLSGQLAVQQTSRLEGGTSTTELRIGLADASGSLSLGGLGAALAHGRGALLLQSSTDTSGQTTSQWALQSEGSVSLTGVSGLNLTLSDMRLGVSNWGSALSTEVLTPGGGYAMNLLAGEQRLSGRGSATINDVLSLSGDLFVESRPNTTVLLSDGSNVSVDQLVIGGSNLSGSLGPSSAALGLDLAQGVLVLNSERLPSGSTASARRWLTSQGRLSGFNLAGYRPDGLEATSLTLNRSLTSSGALGSASDPVVNWGSSVRQISLVNGSSLSLFLFVVHHFFCTEVFANKVGVKFS